MNKIIIYLLLSLFSAFFSCSLNSTNPEESPGSTNSVFDKLNDPAITQYSTVDFVKTNPQKIFVHYMGWYESKEVSGKWGIHWTMANRNPDIILPDGKRQIASYFYPLIGPYDSSDPDLIEYHVLLMKLSGINGAFITWYGQYAPYHYACNECLPVLIKYMDKAGLKYIIIYDDWIMDGLLSDGYAATAYDALVKEIGYLNDNYFNNNNYVKYKGKPIFFDFGPRAVCLKSHSLWTNVIGHFNNQIEYMPLWGWYQVFYTGPFPYIGEYTFLTTIEGMEVWYTNSMPDYSFAVGSGEPGFNDFYSNGGWNTPHYEIPYNNYGTFSNFLSLTAKYKPDIFQIVTWNDFGEGTQIEPTYEDTNKYLEMVQDFSEVQINHDDLSIPYKIYQLRKKYRNNRDMQIELSDIFYLIISGQLDAAKLRLNVLN